jgi:hypothetical protein
VRSATFPVGGPTRDVTPRRAAVTVAATFIRVAFGRPEKNAVATVLLVVLLLALAAALVARGSRDGWGIYGVMLIAATDSRQWTGR